MTTETEQRAPLSRELVLRAAVAVADEGGIEALTMRNLAKHLGVEAMSLYYHVENKAALLDGAVDVVIGEILERVGELDAPAPEQDWKGAMRSRILGARQVLLRHPWAPAIMEQQAILSPSIVLYHEGVLEIFHEGGFSYDLAHHALHALGSRALGFAQELFQPDDSSPDEGSTESLSGQFPHLLAMLSEISHDDPGSTLGWCDDQTEFEFGLDLLLDGLDRLRQAS